MGMKHRKYVNYEITQLEHVFGQAVGDFAALEELQEELVSRSTLRAKELLERVKGSLNDTPAKTSISPKPVKKRRQYLSTQNKQRKRQQCAQSKPVKPATDDHDNTAHAVMTNKADNILNAWSALEALSPYTYQKPADLITNNGSFAYIQPGKEIWLKGEKAPQHCRLYYLVYLGAVDLVEASKKLLTIYPDNRVEPPINRGLAPLGAVLLDSYGIPVANHGLTLSSFGWAYAKILQGKIEQLTSWPTAKHALISGLSKIIYCQDKHGKRLPFTFEQAQKVFHWLVKHCDIPRDDIEPPHIAVRLEHPLGTGQPALPQLNSPFLEDLQLSKAAIASNTAGKALTQYLGVDQPEQHYDVLQNKQLLETTLQPHNTPPARWPGKGQQPLVLLQQAAVNLAMQELKYGGLLSINSPPATGNTTVLRDLVAALVVERAKAMCRFNNTDKAFTRVGTIKLGNNTTHLHRLHDTLRGHEMLVLAADDNAATTLCRQLHSRSNLCQDLAQLNYFNTVSDALCAKHSETWGLVAAILDGEKHSRELANTVWWHRDTGLRNYFLSTTAQPDSATDGKHTPSVIAQCHPPQSSKEAKTRWQTARQRFIDSLNKAEKTIARAQSAYESHQTLQEIALSIELSKAQLKQHSKTLQHLHTQVQQLLVTQKSAKQAVLANKNHVTKSLQRRPGLTSRMISTDKYQHWQKSHNALQKNLAASKKALTDLQTHIKRIEKTINEENLVLFRMKSEHDKLKCHQQSALANIESENAICGNKLVTSALWEKPHQQQQLFTPNFTREANKQRDDVFIAAIELHKAFMDSSAQQIRENLDVFFCCLTNQHLAQKLRPLLPDIWSSAFILTPVITSTFAGASAMLKHLPPQNIGWLVINDAARTAPQAAIGAIYRAKRVISVGDPQHIKPIAELPTPLVNRVCANMAVAVDHWIAPNASVQTLSDNANSYKTHTTKGQVNIKTGFPLLVHQRCHEPMFTLFNKLAYAGLLVIASPTCSLSTTSAIEGSKSCWFDIQGKAQEKWCPEEGELVANMLITACTKAGGAPDLVVISPFRFVAERMRQRMRKEAKRLAKTGIKDPDVWIKNTIGTVHTLHKHEADTVILLLGAPSPNQHRARLWASSTVNFLNVALSTAKHKLYVVGNKQLWGNTGHMKLISKQLS